LTTKVRPRWSFGWCHGYFYEGSALLSDTDMTQVWNWTDSFVGGEFLPYKLFIANGWNATTAARGVRINHNPGHGSAEIEVELTVGPQKIRQLRRRVGAILGSSTPFAAFDTTALDPSLADSQARLKFLANYRSVRTAFQGGTFFGELAETLRMLKSPAHALRKSIDQYVATATKRAHRAIKSKRNHVIQETYLEYSYGWKPLVSDINSIADLIRGGPDSYRSVISGSSTTPTFVDTVRQQADASDGMTLFFTKRSEASVYVRYKGAVSADFEQPPSLAEFTGFGLSNFLPTVWELIPYSFLVDYFSTIGQVIDAASLGIINLSWGCKTVRKSFTVKSSNYDIPYTQNNPSLRLIYKSVSGSGSTSEQVSFTRSSFDQIYAVMADVRFRVPGVDNPWKWLNIASLASQRVLR
jgi:hypothetical protein